MTRLFANRYLLTLLVLLALGAEYGLASMSHPAAGSAGAKVAGPGQRRIAVSTAVRACPGPGSAGATGGGVAVAAASSGSGRAAISRLMPSGSAVTPSALRVLTRAGQLAQVGVRAAAVPHGSRAGRAAAKAPVPTSPAPGGVMVQASGAMARGLEVEQTGAHGLPTAQCNGPGTDFWFVGPGVHSAANIQLYLMNTDNQAADASVNVLTDSGPLLGTGDSGIAIPPHAAVLQSLSKLVRTSRAVALNVRTSVGRVAAAVRETSSTGRPGGWLPPTQAPARSQVLPGLPGSAGSRELYIAVPGTGNAQVRVTAVTGRGSYHPTGGNGINLPGGSAVEVALPSLDGIPAAVKLSSNVPVTATMMVSGGAGGSPGAFAAAAAPVQQQGVIAVNQAKAELVLSAPLGPARVRVTALATAHGQSGTPGKAAGPASRVVPVRAGHTVVTRINRPPGSARRSSFGIVVTPLSGSGPLYAGRVVSTGATVKVILPVPSSLAWVGLPSVRNSLTTALP